MSVIVGLSVVLGAVAAGVVRSVLTKEIEGWLEAIPGRLLRLASRRLPVSHRDDLYDEWNAELHCVLHEAAARPLTRAVRGIRFTAGLLRSARRIAAELGTTRLSSFKDSADVGVCESVPHALPDHRPTRPQSQGGADRYLDLLEGVITTIRHIERGRWQARALPYRRAQLVHEETSSIGRAYRFEFDKPMQVTGGALVEVDDDSGTWGTILRTEPNAIIVELSTRADRRHVPMAGGLLHISRGTFELRQRQALSALRKGCSTNPHLLDILAGGVFRPFDLHEARVTQPRMLLDDVQAEAVARACAVPDLLLVTAAPGTGKVTAITEIVRQCVHNGERALVISPTRLGVDNLLNRMPPDLRALRVANGEHRKAQPDNHQSIHDVDVVVGTCKKVALSDLTSSAEFDILIVDEAERIPLLELLVPLVNSKRAVLVGDHRQLPPFVDPDVRSWLNELTPCSIENRPTEDIRALLTTSAFELLLQDAPHSHVISFFRQRRMPPAIADFVSRHFYNGNLTTDAWRVDSNPTDDRVLVNSFTIVDTSDQPRVRRTERTAPHVGRPGLANSVEAELIVKLIIAEASKWTDWAVIVPYRAQADLIRRYLRNSHPNGTRLAANVGTIDSFAATAYDVIIFGCTRSNTRGGVGFLTDFRRLNVAMTRTTRQLVVLGDMQTLTTARDHDVRALWKDMLAHVRQRGELLSSHDLTKRLQRDQGDAAAS